MARKRTASVKTLQQNVSHIRKMISRLGDMAMSVPSQNTKPVKVRRQGSRLIIDGVVYKPADLDKLKGKTADWQLLVISELELQLAREQYRLEQSGHRARKTEALSKMEVEHARKGYSMITSDTELEFRNWLNDWSGKGGTDMETKNQFYHVFRADDINRGTIRGFMQYVSDMTGMEVDNVEELDVAFSQLLS